MKLAFKLASIHPQHIYHMPAKLAFNYICVRLDFWKMKTIPSIHSLVPYMPCLSLAPKTAAPPKKNKNWRNESLLSPNNKTKQQRFLANNINPYKQYYSNTSGC